MSAPENVFKGDASQLSGIDIDSLLASAKAPSCGYFLEPLGKAAKEAEDKNETQKAAVFRFLQVIAGFSPSFDTPSQPFVPMWQMVQLEAARLTKSGGSASAKRADSRAKTVAKKTDATKYVSSF